MDWIDRSGKRIIEPRYTGTPKFVKELLSKTKLTDGKAEPVGTHQTIDSPVKLDHLIEVIEDTERISAVFVTSAPKSVDPDSWFHRTSELLRNTEGLGIGYFLTPDMLRSFNDWVGTYHSVGPGDLRTFLPGAIFGDSRDGLNHRVLRASTIRDRDPEKLRRRLRNAQVNRLASVRLPDVLRRIDIEFSDPRLDRDTRQDVESGISSENEMSVHREIGVLTELLDIADKESSDLRLVIDEIKPDLLALQDENDLLYLELSSYREKLEKSKRQSAVLRKQLADHEIYELSNAYYEAAEFRLSIPSTFEDLLERIEELRYVRFFGDREITEELDDFTDLGVTIVQKTWEALLTFEAYAEARDSGDYSSGLIQYQRNSDHGHYMNIRQLSPNESDTVQQNKRMREQRTFDVPTEVHPDGRMLMLSHIKLTTGRGRSPRLYFADTWPEAGYVSVGYIGPHLDNKSTN